MNNFDISDYDYYLPDEKIARYPANERDRSKLLLYRDGAISSDTFLNIDKYLPPDSLLVFNNTRVIHARLLFKKSSGAAIEVFCLEPLSPSNYEMSFGSKDPVEWKCLVGNLKKWKNEALVLTFGIKGKDYRLTAENRGSEREARRIRFSWSSSEISFSEVLEAAGHIPLPPYIDREDEEDDKKRYQTVYSSIRGSVAAPTAGLHFSADVMKRISAKGIKKAELTLHVGAGTFQPVKSSNLSEHIMHSEHFFVTRDAIKTLLQKRDKVIAVGTTTVRTLESLFWAGVQIIDKKLPENGYVKIDQWEPYRHNPGISAGESLNAILEFMSREGADTFSAATNIMIIPGYNFMITGGLITNFHQPRSTLLLLIAAWTGEKWRSIYEYALRNNFRFLSYGDASLLFR